MSVIPVDRRPSDEKTERSPLRPAVVDKRRIGRPGAVSREPSTKPTFVEELEAKVARMETALAEKLALVERETVRSRERLLRDLEKRFDEREEALLLEVLDLLDDLDRACDCASESPAIREGLALVASRASRFLERHGCARVAPDGEPFDPRTMEAVALLPGEKDRVVAVYRPAIIRGEKLLRPARVAVGSGTPEEKG